MFECSNERMFECFGAAAQIAGAAGNVVYYAAKGGKDMCMFNAVIYAEKNGEWWAEVPALPGCYAMGQSRAEVCSNVREAIAMHLEELSKDDVPEGAELERVAL